MYNYIPVYRSKIIFQKEAIQIGKILLKQLHTSWTQRLYNLLYMSSSSAPQPKYMLEKPLIFSKSARENAVTPPNNVGYGNLLKEQLE